MVTDESKKLLTAVGAYTEGLKDKDKTVPAVREITSGGKQIFHLSLPLKLAPMRKRPVKTGPLLKRLKDCRLLGNS